MKRKNKCGQHEIVGFVLIILIVTIIGVVFLGFSINRGEVSKQESVELSNLLEASMYYTTDCAVSFIPQYKDMQDLIKSCYKNEKCLNDKMACVVLEEELKNLVDKSLNIGKAILQNISNDLEKNKGINKVIICHFIGKFEVGEDLVYVGIASGHRKELFPIYKEAIERYKTEGLFWKKEKTKDGKEHWIEK